MSTAERTLPANWLERSRERSHEEPSAEQAVRGADSAGAPPEWMMLQQEIHNRLVQLKKLTELGVTGGLDDSLEELNRKIEAYNDLIPTTMLQKPKVSRDNFAGQMNVWKSFHSAI